MKKKVFDRLVEKELKIFKNYVLDDDEFMIEFLSNMSIDFDNYITHDTVFRDYFGMHFYPLLAQSQSRGLYWYYRFLYTGIYGLHNVHP